MVFFRGAEKKLKAAKALKEKGGTPEELLQSIKENEAAVAEAQRTVDAWKAIVGEKARREEAAKAEAEQAAGHGATPQRTWWGEKELMARFICEVVSLIHVHEIFSDALETETE